MNSRFLAVLVVLGVASGVARPGDSDARSGSTDLALTIAVPVLGPGAERSIVAFDPHSHFHVSLTNLSGKPQRIAAEGNSWGDEALSFEMTDQSGKRSLARRVQEPRAKNMLHWWILQPQESVVMDIYFADPGQWEDFPHPGRYGGSKTITLKAIFETKTARPRDGLWAGRAMSASAQYVFYNRMSRSR